MTVKGIYRVGPLGSVGRALCIGCLFGVFLSLFPGSLVAVPVQSRTVLTTESRTVDKSETSSRQVPSRRFLKDKQETLILLDLSSSMNGRIQGTKKIDHVKEALLEFLDSLPAKEWIGLRVLGNGLGCGSTKLLVPIAQDNKDTLKGLISDLRPSGLTPLALALERSTKDFDWTREGEKLILLLSDGEDSCGGDPCAVIQRIKADHPDLGIRIDVVALDVARRAQRQLACLADLTGGELIVLQGGDLSRLGEILSGISARAQTLFYQIIALVLGTISLFLLAEMTYDLLTRNLPIGRGSAGVLLTVGGGTLEAILVILTF